MHSLRVALPKGRMGKESLAFFFQNSITKLESFGDSRKLIFKDSEEDIEFLLIRSKDVGTYVETGAADLGIIGHDLLTEHRFDVYTPCSLPFGGCRMSVAHPNGKTKWKERRNLTVATKYPNITKKYFHDAGYNVKIIQLYGSLEIAPLTGISDIIVDLVSTGQTLKANKLTESGVILESTARLIVNSGSYVHKHERLRNMIDKLAAH